MKLENTTANEVTYWYTNKLGELKNKFIRTNDSWTDDLIVGSIIGIYHTGNVGTSGATRLESIINYHDYDWQLSIYKILDQKSGYINPHD